MERFFDRLPGRPSHEPPFHDTAAAVRPSQSRQFRSRGPVGSVASVRSAGRGTHSGRLEGPVQRGGSLGLAGFGRRPFANDIEKRKDSRA